MERFAVVDIGNTAVKMSICSGEGDDIRCHVASISEALKMAREEGCKGGVYSTTRVVGELEERAMAEAGWIRVDGNSRLPISIGYATPATLGADRIAAAVAAWARFPGEGVVVADLGTALTLDVVTERGEFVGGNISVGLALRLKALNEYTSRLPLAGIDAGAKPVGRDTIGALQSGAMWGVAWEIAGFAAMAFRDYGCRWLLLTGGDAHYVADALKGSLGKGIEMVHVPRLVEEGLKEIYRRL